MVWWPSQSPAGCIVTLFFPRAGCAGGVAVGDPQGLSRAGNSLSASQAAGMGRGRSLSPDLPTNPALLLIRSLIHGTGAKPVSAGSSTQELMAPCQRWFSGIKKHFPSHKVGVKIPVFWDCWRDGVLWEWGSLDSLVNLLPSKKKTRFNQIQGNAAIETQEI